MLCQPCQSTDEGRRVSKNRCSNLRGISKTESTEERKEKKRERNGKERDQKEKKKI
jgi:hypothetical protein